MIAALLLFAAAVAIFAPGVVRILRANAELDRLADPTWQPDYDAPDYEANVNAGWVR